MEAENAALKPKAEALERIAVADGSLCITDAAKTLQVMPKELFAWLSQHKIPQPKSTCVTSCVTYQRFMAQYGSKQVIQLSMFQAKKSPKTGLSD